MNSDEFLDIPLLSSLRLAGIISSCRLISPFDHPDYGNFAVGLSRIANGDKEKREIGSISVFDAQRNSLDLARALH